MTKWITLVLLLALLLSSITLTGCSSGDDDETQPEEAATQTEKATSEPTEQVSPEETQPEEVTSDPTEEASPEDDPNAGGFSWDDIPIYSGAELDTTGGCPTQWQECETCEHQVYITDASPEDVCSFYEDEMPAQDWDKLNYQFYPEGSCMGTWMEDMGNSSGPRIFLNVGQQSSNEDTTFIAITMGSGCP